MELVYFVVVVLAVLGTMALDRQAWRTAPRRATAISAFSLRRLRCKRRRSLSQQANGGCFPAKGPATPSKSAGPWIADVAPGAILAGGSGMLAICGLSSYVLFAIGWMVLA